MAIDLIRIDSVISSMVKSVSYNYALGTLRVVFYNDKAYEYKDVPADVYQQVINAPSHGRAFNALVKDQYTFIRLNEKTANGQT